MYIPSQHFEFRDVKQQVLCTRNRNVHEKLETQSCSTLLQNPDPNVADDFISLCCTITEYQPVNSLWLERIKCKSKETENVIRLSNEARTLIIINCFNPCACHKCGNITVHLSTYWRRTQRGNTEFYSYLRSLFI